MAIGKELLPFFKSAAVCSAVQKANGHIQSWKHPFPRSRKLKALITPDWKGWSKWSYSDQRDQQISSRYDFDQLFPVGAFCNCGVLFGSGLIPSHLPNKALLQKKKMGKVYVLFTFYVCTAAAGGGRGGGFTFFVCTGAGRVRYSATRSSIYGLASSWWNMYIVLMLSINFWAARRPVCSLLNGLRNQPEL
jgi:hypothetical protein